MAYLVKPSTEKEGRCRFARHPVAVAYSGRAHAMMSHYWDGSWGTLIAAAAQGANMGRFIWICALANRCVLFVVFYLLLFIHDHLKLRAGFFSLINE